MTAPDSGAAKHPQKSPPANSPERDARLRPRRRRTETFITATIHLRPDAFRASEEDEASSAATATASTNPFRPAWGFASVVIGKNGSAVVQVTAYDSAALLIQSEGTAGRRRVEL